MSQVWSGQSWPSRSPLPVIDLQVTMWPTSSQLNIKGNVLGRFLEIYTWLIKKRLKKKKGISVLDPSLLPFCICTLSCLLNIIHLFLPNRTQPGDCHCSSYRITTKENIASPLSWQKKNMRIKTCQPTGPILEPPSADFLLSDMINPCTV